MRKGIIIASIVAVAITVYVVWSYVNHIDYLGKTVHEADRWAVIMDSKGDIISVETVSDKVWSQLVGLHQNQTKMWIGGVVQEYNNIWGFRFKPDTITIAQFTIEAAQSNIRGISGDLHYWMNTWAKETYVSARVTEIHQ